jgi:hypothetical protein
VMMLKEMFCGSCAFGGSVAAGQLPRRPNWASLRILHLALLRLSSGWPLRDDHCEKC